MTSMHEMSTVIRLVNLALHTIEQEGAEHILAVHVDVGEMTDIVPAYLIRYYPEAVKGTVLEGTALVPRTVPVSVRCSSCGHIYHPDREHKYRCPRCNSASAAVLQGRSVTLTSIEYDEGRPHSAFH